MAYRGGYFNWKQFYRHPHISLLQMKELFPSLDLKIKKAKDGSIVDVRPANDARNMAIVMSACYSFHHDGSHQLYGATKKGSYVHVDPYELGLLMSQIFSEYGFGKTSAFSSDRVYDELLQLPRVANSTVEPLTVFHPQEWDGENRLDRVLTHFFKLSDYDGPRQTWAFLTMLFQWYAVTLDWGDASFTVAPVIVSTQQGIGKSHMVRLLGELGDGQVLSLSGWRDFNDSGVMALLPTSSILFYDEMDRSALRRDYDTAKRIATSTDFKINPKYMKPYHFRRTQPLILSTNNTDVLPDDANRRFPLIEVSNNPDSPLAHGDVEGAKAFLQQVLNQVAYVFDRLDGYDRQALLKWNAKDNAGDADESKLELAEVFNNIVFRHCQKVGETKELSISEFYDYATIDEANLLIDRLAKDKQPLVEGTPHLGEVINSRLFRGSFAQLVTAYNDLVAKNYQEEVIASRARRTTGGKRVRLIDIRNHRYLNEETPQLTPFYVVEKEDETLKERRLILERALGVKKQAAIYEQPVWCATKIGKKKNKVTKLPFSAKTQKPLSGAYNSPERNAQLVDFEGAKNYVKRKGNYELAVSIDESTPIACVDVDGSKIHPDFFPSGVGIEDSVSGRGQHIYYAISSDLKKFGLAPSLEKGKKVQGLLHAPDLEGNWRDHKVEVFIRFGVVTLTDETVLNRLRGNTLWHLDLISEGLRPEKELGVDSFEGSVQKEEELVGYLNAYMVKQDLSFKEGCRHDVLGKLVGAFAAKRIDLSLLPSLKAYVRGLDPTWDELDQEFDHWIQYVKDQGSFDYATVA